MRVAVLLLLVLVAVPVAPIAALRFLPPPTSAFMLQSQVRPVAYRWVPLHRIAPELAAAVIAAEDQKFHDHSGFDFEAIREAFAANAQRRRPRGASTISQQTAKNLFLWPGGGYLRKGIEAYLTLWIEALWPKPRILEVYLNIAEFAPGVYGAEAAARRHFGKPAARLSVEEAALLAAVLPNPRRWRASAPGPYVRARSAWILGQMGYGTTATPSEEPDESLEPETDAAPPPASPGPEPDGFDAWQDEPDAVPAEPETLPHEPQAVPQEHEAPRDAGDMPQPGIAPPAGTDGDAAADTPAAPAAPQPSPAPLSPEDDPAAPRSEGGEAPRSEEPAASSASSASTASASTGLTR